MKTQMAPDTEEDWESELRRRILERRPEWDLTEEDLPSEDEVERYTEEGELIETPSARDRAEQNLYEERRRRVEEEQEELQEEIRRESYLESGAEIPLPGSLPRHGPNVWWEQQPWEKYLDQYSRIAGYASRMHKEDQRVNYPLVQELDAYLQSPATVPEKQKAVRRWVRHLYRWSQPSSPLPPQDGSGWPGAEPDALYSVHWLHEESAGWRGYQLERSRRNETKRDRAKRNEQLREFRAKSWLLNQGRRRLEDARKRNLGTDALMIQIKKRLAVLPPEVADACRAELGL